MTQTYNVVDAEGHPRAARSVDNYIDPKFHNRRPRFTIDENGKEHA